MCPTDKRSNTLLDIAERLSSYELFGESLLAPGYTVVFETGLGGAMDAACIASTECGLFCCIDIIVLLLFIGWLLNAGMRAVPLLE